MGRKHGIFSIQSEEVNISTKKKVVKRKGIVYCKILPIVG